MLPPAPAPEHARINLRELKSRISRKLGPEKTRSYFASLAEMLAQKLIKAEFNKFCLSTLGREFVPLHNHLIRSIINNACCADMPPPLAAAHDSGKKSRQENGKFNPPVWSNGDVVLPPSPRKSRSTVRERRIKDRPIPFVPNGHHSLTASDNNFRDNGFFSTCDLKRAVQQQRNEIAEQRAKRSRDENVLIRDQTSVHSKGLVEVGNGIHMEELEHKNYSNSSRNPLRAPFGIPFCHARVGGAQRSLPLATRCRISSSYDSGDLCHTEDLRNRMERIAEAQDLGSVTEDCAGLLNHGLDAYLKRIIKSCVELVGARSGYRFIKQAVYEQQPGRKPINGVLPGSHMHVQSSRAPLQYANDLTNKRPISLQDFKVAMELNLQQLGEGWPSLLEKIYLRSFEE